MIPRHLVIAVAVMLAGVLAVGFYALHLKRAAEQPGPAAQDTRPVTPPVARVPAQVTLVVANDADGSLSAAPVQLDIPKDDVDRPREILRALLARYTQSPSAHPLAPQADINEVYIVGGKLAVVDVNAAFADGHPSGILVEELTLASLAQTLAAASPGITQLKLIVDGRERPTLAGHADLSQPYDIANATRLLRLVK
jgi:prepilin-type processing-associated H-X9-DG protein